MLADAGPFAVLANRPLAAVLADAGPLAVLALVLDTAVLADAGPRAVLALVLSAAILAFRRGSTVFDIISCVGSIRISLISLKAPFSLVLGPNLNRCMAVLCYLMEN